MGFRGGKGVATSLGVGLAIVPVVTLAELEGTAWFGESRRGVSGLTLWLVDGSGKRIKRVRTSSGRFEFQRPERFRFGVPDTLEFFGDMHAEIHRSIPLIQNCGVMVNGTLYYPGDSFTQPDRVVDVLACPTSAPWLKISEVMDFVAAVKPRKCFATHNVHLSEVGHEMNNGRVKQAVEAGGGVFEYVLPGNSLSI